MEFANKTQLSFGGVSKDISIAVMGDDVYITPGDLMETLGDLARLSYINATLKGYVRTDVNTSADLTVNLSDGATTFASKAITLNNSDFATFKISDIDLSTLSGNALLRMTLDVGATVSAADCFLSATLDITHPVVIGEK